ncbi:MAG TPA: hypothetical protein VEQ16_03590 [Acidocella sp.]|nr:hypothetical protein [Acidocella sp.]
MNWIRKTLSLRNMLCTSALLLFAYGAHAQSSQDSAISMSDVNSFLAKMRDAARHHDQPALCNLLVYPFPLKIDEKGQYSSAKDCEAHFAKTFPPALLEKLQHVRPEDLFEAQGMLVAGNGWIWLSKVWVGTTHFGSSQKDWDYSNAALWQMKILDLDDPGGIMGSP